MKWWCIALALSTAINNLADLPVTAVPAVGVVTLTARNKGLVANQIDVVATITANIATTVTVVTLANGTIDPTIQSALDVVYASQYSLIVTPYNGVAPLQVGPGQTVQIVRAILERLKAGCNNTRTIPFLGETIIPSITNT
jgi:phage tail sheath gpL-like